MYLKRSQCIGQQWPPRQNKYKTFKYRKRKRKLLAKKWRDLLMKVTQKDTGSLIEDHRCLSESEGSKCMWPHIFTLFWLIKTSVIKMFRLSFHVFVCAFLHSFSNSFLFFVFSTSELTVPCGNFKIVCIGSTDGTNVTKLMRWVLP